MQAAWWIHFLAVAVLALAMVYAGFSDIRGFRIPNRIPLAITAAFFPAALAEGWGVVAVLANVSAGAAVLGICWLLFHRGLLGGGDAKLLASGGLWTGWEVLPTYLLGVALLGGVLAILIVLFRRFRLAPALASRAWIRQLHATEQGVPYGIAIAGAAILVFPGLPVVAGIMA